ncbi:hypothetical protein [Blastopirellula marina]|uniref:F5/8 type C domain-containing protein n=1 Tax=Blastopirellula marina TaxID=124 RepID=A0A2S8FNH7_9BACT|nr:hypothetical protein [Blastopirellula marina]PQO33707.1 hypothetical protein C5Y98_15860 [Blastopirellula marina]PTL43494.1 hypothetical protein C5Y97_15870 [Blastopirellula marina]
MRFIILITNLANQHVGVLALLLFLLGSAGRADAVEKAALVIVGKQNCDLCQVLQKNDVPFAIAADATEALQLVRDQGAVAILADTYPDQTTDVPGSFFSQAANKQLRVYLEFPQSIPGVAIGAPTDVRWERVVVASNELSPQLKPRQILSMNRCRYVPIESKSSLLVLARVAGLDTAVYGIPDNALSLLVYLPATNERPEMYVATSKMSDFVTARYAPAKAWADVWSGLLGKLDTSLAAIHLEWVPTVRPSYTAQEKLPEDVEREALRRGAQWFMKSGLLLTEKSTVTSRDKIAISEVAHSKDFRNELGDGRLGMLEGFDSGILPDGSQRVRVIQRSDCISETAMGLGIAGEVIDDPQMSAIAKNLQEYLYLRSGAVSGDRGDPNHPSYGMIAWGVSNDAWQRANYGDDIARVLLASMATEAATDDQRWNPYISRAIVAGLRTTGTMGFKPGRIDQNELTQNGWQYYLEQSSIYPSPHFQCYLWACYLWAYEQSGDALLLERARTGIQIMMSHYPDGWRWTNGIQQERARMLLPLAWLVRVDDRPEHRRWLRQIAEDVIACQDASGAIREELGRLDRGAYPPHHNNESFGAHEAPLIHENGEPICDLLYTTNFAFIGLHEAAAATGDPFYQDAEDKLAAFLCRIQTKSEAHPELDGAWMRAFDYQRWEFWGSNGDAGWGAWSIESGWTQGWIVAVLGMRQANTSLWEMAKQLDAHQDYDKYRQQMLPQDIVSRVKPQLIQHDGYFASVKLANSPAPRYSGLGNKTLTNGLAGPASYQDSQWLGIEGEALVAELEFKDPLTLKTVDVHTLQETPVGIYYPRSIRVSVADGDGKFQPWASLKCEQNDAYSKQAKWIQLSGKPVSSKRIKVEVESRGTIPDGHHAAGKPAWLFVSEIAINRSNSDKKEAM